MAPERQRQQPRPPRDADVKLDDLTGKQKLTRTGPEFDRAAIGGERTFVLRKGPLRRAANAGFAALAYKALARPEKRRTSRVTY